MLESATAVELYQRITAAFEVNTLYKVSFNRELSPDVLEIISFLKGDLHAQDLIPFPTSLSISVRIPGQLVKIFHQDSNTYMEAFDKNAFREFASECLKLSSSEITIDIPT